MRSLYLILVVVLITFSMIPASAGKITTGRAPMGWFFVAQVTDQFNNALASVIVGGTDSPSDAGVQATYQGFTGIHIGIGNQGASWWDVAPSSRMKVVKDIYVWSDDPTIKTVFIHWFTMGSDYEVTKVTKVPKK